MKDNYFSSYNSVKRISFFSRKLRFFSLILSFLVLITPLLFSVLETYSKRIVEKANSYRTNSPSVLGVQEKIVRAEEAFPETVVTGQIVSIEERTLLIKKASSEIQFIDKRALALKTYLQIMKCSDGSFPPLMDYAEDLINSADKYGLDWRYTTAISGVESWFGCAGGADDYKNAWGYGGGPATRFRYNSWEEGIDSFTKGFAEGYGTNVDFYDISSFYTRGVSGKNDRWADGVSSYLSGIDFIERSL